MTRAQQTTSLALLVSSLPFWVLISFGSYLLARLGYNVMTFNDVPEAHKELMAEIDEAVVDLRKLGVDVDYD
ncbi:dolichyl-phosphate mannosyltransferase polypeptide 3 [Colletotrichum tofieldiae]|nr:dolichyl-phosphate mannosyltransferase polypeptide 3 [Colletotrichum tofieldiae]